MNYEIGDRVWTGSFFRGKNNEIKVCIAQREIVSVMPNYCGRPDNLYYGLVNVKHLRKIRATIRKTGEPIRMFGCAYRPNAIFENEADAQAHVVWQIRKEIEALHSFLREIPSLVTGEIHVKIV